jgi:hypothetical protein
MGNARTRKGQLLSWNEGSDWLRNMNMGNNFKKDGARKIGRKREAW